MTFALVSPDPQGWATWMTGPVAAVMELTARTAPTFQGVIGIEFLSTSCTGDSAWRYVDYDLARVCDALHEAGAAGTTLFLSSLSW
jgi:hypothetical protein